MHGITALQSGPNSAPTAAALRRAPAPPKPKLAGVKFFPGWIAH